MCLLPFAEYLPAFQLHPSSVLPHAHQHAGHTTRDSAIFHNSTEREIRGVSSWKEMRQPCGSLTQFPGAETEPQSQSVRVPENSTLGKASSLVMIHRLAL